MELLSLSTLGLSIEILFDKNYHVGYVSPEFIITYSFPQAWY